MEFGKSGGEGEEEGIPSQIHPAGTPETFFSPSLVVRDKGREERTRKASRKCGNAFFLVGNERSLISQSCCWWGYFITAAAATQSFRQEKGELEQSPPFFSTQWSEFALYRKALESIAWEGWIKANCLFSKESTCGWVWYLVSCSKCYTTNLSLHEPHLHRGKLSRFELKNTCVDITQDGNLYATTDSRQFFFLRIVQICPKPSPDASTFRLF